MALQVWLPLQGNLRNQGSNGATATASGAVAVANGDKLGQCYQFGTATGRITLPASTMTSFTECTVAFWVKVLGWQTSWDTFFQAGLGSSPWNSYTFGVLRNQGNSLCFAISDGSSSTQGNCKTSDLTLNTWYHVAFSYKSGHMYTYVNGVLTQDYSTSIVPNFAGITYVSIGQLGNANSYQTNCQMSNFRIYNNALSAQEIAKLSGKMPKGLLIWHPFNKDTHNQGVLRTTNFSVNSLTENANGKLGKCYSGGAIYHYTEEVMSNVWTLACWVRSSGWGQYNDILLCKNTDSSDNCQFYMSVVGGNTFNIGVNGSSSTSQYSYTFATNTWYHLCCTYDGGNIKQYLNGALVKTTVYSSTQKTSLYNIGINCRSTNAVGTSTTGTGSNYLNDVRIYDSCLSPEQVKWLSKGLILHWRLDRNGAGPDNLIKNGFGELGTENWTSSTNISTSDIPSGHSEIKASFVSNSTIEPIPISPNLTYKFSAWVKGTATSGYTYPSLYPYDIDGKFIDYYKCPDGFNTNTMTTLKQQLKSGDTKIYVNDLSQWNANNGHYFNWAAIFSYTDSHGHVYPDGQYTQNCAQFGSGTNAKTNLDKTNNIITLVRAYSGPTMPVGTKVCASTEGSTYYYPLGGINLANIQDWTYMEGTFSGNTNRLKYAKTVSFFTYYNVKLAGIKLESTTLNTVIPFKEHDGSGFGYDGLKAGSLSYSSDVPKYNATTIFPNNCAARIFNTDVPKITKNLTFACWCKIQQGSNSSFSFIVSQGRDNTQDGFNIILNGTEYALHGSFGSLKSGVTVDNTWKHIVGTYDGANVKIYINGVLKNTLAYTSDLVYNYAPAFLVGKMAYSYTSDGSYFPTNGSISDVRIYATALSANDVLALYNNTAALDTTTNPVTVYGKIRP